jgi:hypothetical protein
MGKNADTGFKVTGMLPLNIDCITEYIFCQKATVKNFQGHRKHLKQDLPQIVL